MPHLTLEYTANLEEDAPSPELLLRIHGVLERVGGIKIENCKSRWRKVEDWVVGDGEAPSAFVHLDLRFLEGRSEDTRRAIGDATLEVLKTHFQPRNPELDLQITVEVQDIRSGTYFKDPPGTLRSPPTTSV
jgi:5-carboxymethyl-2-hydroxymuconate isomerase